jgi:hypothetical protein
MGVDLDIRGRDMKALPTLRELTDQQLELLNMADVPEDVLRDTLEGLEGAITAKAENIVAVINRLESDAEACKAEEKRLAELRRSREAHAKRLREYLKFHMERLGVEKIECPLFKIAIKSNPPAVKIEDESLIPLNYTRIPDPEIDKAAIKRDLLAGKDVPGAVLESGTRVEIR